MSRFTPGMDILGKAAALTDSSVAAERVCMDLLRYNPNYLDLLDKHGIYGPAIYRVWKDVCRESTPHMGLLIDACDANLAGVTGKKIMEAAENCGYTINIKAVVTHMQLLAD